MAYKNLYIIGNGFDQHHDIPCGFPSFMNWIKEHDAGLFYKLNRVYNNDAWKKDWWNDFENSLAQLNISYYSNNEGNLYDPEKIKEGSIKERTELASHKVIGEFSSIKRNLRKDFYDWLKEEYEKCKEDKKIQLSIENNIFITFNYTKTLEDIYRIKLEQICHIHGIIDNQDSMIVGHGLGLEELKDIYERQRPRIASEVNHKGLNTQIQYIIPEHKVLTKKTTLGSVLSLKKDVDGCIERNKWFFDKILEVQTIYVYGFSFSSIDMPYLEKIIRRTDKDTHWVISWYSQEDKRRIMNFVMKYDIRNFTMINGIKKICVQ